MDVEKTHTYQLLTAKDASQLCRLSKRSWHRLNSCGKIPAPVRIGGSVRWRASDIKLFLKWDCPDRKEFEARREADNVS